MRPESARPGVEVLPNSTPLLERATIPLQPGYLAAHGRTAARDAIRRVVRSVQFAFAEDDAGFRLLGPEMSYHAVDPYLPTVLAQMGLAATPAAVQAFHARRPAFDLCFEDSWTGHFIARHFEPDGPPDELLLIHLDDHADMMPTLLGCEDGRLTDPTTGRSFDPWVSGDWPAVMASGAVGIGNYITPYFFGATRLHVRHLNNAAGIGEMMTVSRVPCRYEIIPGRSFADIGKSAAASSGSGAGTCLTGSDPTQLLAGLPSLPALVHIDLDYFINDFNGASRTAGYVPSPGLREEATQKMGAFFNALSAAPCQIRGWIVGTSPGFCSAFHWAWLLETLDQRISAFMAQRRPA